MKKLALLLAMTLPMGMMAAEYTKDMKKAMKAFQQAESVADFVQTSNMFSEIASANPDEWEAAYYETFCLVSAGFDAAEFGEKEGYLDKAEGQIESMMAKWKGNAELWTLKGMYFCARLMADFRRAPSLSPKIAGCAQEALRLDATNPRAKFLKIPNDIGLAEFMGRDTVPNCQEAKTVLENFDSYKVTNDWSPQWGKEQLEGIINGCK